MLSAVDAEDCANFARPATAVDAPATMAVPHFAAVFMPLRRGLQTLLNRLSTI